MMRLAMRQVLPLALAAVLLLTGIALAGPSAVSLSVDRTEVRPGDPLAVSFSVAPGVKGNAWIGIIPSHVPHGSEAVNDQHDITYQHLKNRSRGVMNFTAPTTPGSYDVRFNDTDDNGVELAFVSFVVRGQAGPAAPVAERDAYTREPSSGDGEATLWLDRNVYRQGEQIRLRFTAPSHYASNAWIGIIPSHIPHGREEVNDQHDVTYQYIKNRTSGEMLFQAPRPGRWDFRLHDTDNNGREITSVTFTVR